MTPLASLENVSVTLGGRKALDAVSLQITPGRIAALLGANGAGKSTLIRALFGLMPLTSGHATLGDRDARALGVRERALRAAYLPQRPQAVWPVPVKQLVALGRFAHGAAPDRLAPRDQQAVDAALVSCGLTELRARRMDEISGGESARVHLARALAQGAPLLVLDEPTAGLDPAQSMAVGEILAAHAKAGDGVLVATHDIGLAARVAHEVMLLGGGRVLAQGAPREALTPEVLHRAFGRPAALHWIDGGLVPIFR